MKRMAIVLSALLWALYSSNVLAVTLTTNSLNNIYSYGFNQEHNLNYVDPIEVRSIGPVTMTWSASPRQTSALID